MAGAIDSHAIEHNYTPLDCAMAHGQISTVLQMIAQLSLNNLSTSNAHGYNPLHGAIWMGTNW